MRSHQFPQPMWKEDGSIDYAPNAQGVEKMKKEGWREEKVLLKFPMAVHGGNNQSLSVKDESELKRALANGWSVKPVIVEAPENLPPSPDRPPLAVADDEEKQLEVATRPSGKERRSA